MPAFQCKISIDKKKQHPYTPEKQYFVMYLIRKIRFHHPEWPFIQMITESWRSKYEY